MLDVRILDEAQAVLDALLEKYRYQIIKKIALLAQQPYHPRSKQLEGYAPLRRISSGEYRIIYFVEGNVLKVPLIDKRGDDKVYRRLQQLFGYVRRPRRSESRIQSLRHRPAQRAGGDHRKQEVRHSLALDELANWAILNV